MADCLFCKIVEGEIPSNKLFEDDTVLAFRDIQPAAPVHALIIPKKHIPTMNDAQGDDWEVMGHIHEVAQQVAKDLGVAESGYRLVNNCGEHAGQVVFHIHFHLIGGHRLGTMN